MTDEQKDVCQHPCDPQAGCPECAAYWNRMRDDGLWVDGQGWTVKAQEEWNK